MNQHVISDLQKIQSLLTSSLSYYSKDDNLSTKYIYGSMYLIRDYLSSFLILFEGKRYSSTYPIIRALFELVIQILWTWYCCPDNELEKSFKNKKHRFTKNDSGKPRKYTIKDMANELDNYFKNIEFKDKNDNNKRISKMFTPFVSKNWRKLSSYTHNNIFLQIMNRTSDNNSLIQNFDKDELEYCLACTILPTLIISMFFFRISNEKDKLEELENIYLPKVSEIAIAQYITASDYEKEDCEECTIRYLAENINYQEDACILCKIVTEANNQEKAEENV